MNMKFIRTWAMLALTLVIGLSVTGGTIAWFTDSVSSTNNVIESGNLDVVLEYKLPNSDDWAPVEENTVLFGGNRWEPGFTQAVAFRVTNAGTLALKYDMQVKLLSETTSTNVYGEEFKLSDYLTVINTATQDGGPVGEIYMDQFLSSRDRVMGEGMEKMTKATFDTPITFITGSDQGTPITATEISLLPDEARVFGVAITMPTTVGNEANHKTDIAAPVVNLGIVLRATQLASESDAFNNQYDANAPLGTLPIAFVSEMKEEERTGLTLSRFAGFGPESVPDSLKDPGKDTLTLDYGLTFKATETIEELAGKPYENWNADFVVTSNKAVTEDDYANGAPLVLVGEYGDYGWVPVAVNFDVEANSENRLLAPFGTFTYKDVLNFVGTFNCGIKASPAWATPGTAITVKLNVYETNADGNEVAAHTVATYTYTYPN